MMSIQESYIQSAVNEIRCLCLWCDGWDGLKNQDDICSQEDAYERVS